jgi:hypothetical protein
VIDVHFGIVYCEVEERENDSLYFVTVYNRHMLLGYMRNEKNRCIVNALNSSNTFSLLESILDFLVYIFGERKLLITGGKSHSIDACYILASNQICM